MKMISMVLGFLTFTVMFIALIPCLGWINWLNIPVATIGIIVSMIDISKSNYENRTPSIAALVMCTLAVFVGLARLAVGCGIF